MTGADVKPTPSLSHGAHVPHAIFMFCRTVMAVLAKWQIIELALHLPVSRRDGRSVAAAEELAKEAGHDLWVSSHAVVAMLQSQ